MFCVVSYKVLITMYKEINTISMFTFKILIKNTPITFKETIFYGMIKFNAFFRFVSVYVYTKAIISPTL